MKHSLSEIKGITIFRPVQGICSDVLPEISTVVQIMKQNFRTGMAIACCLMMIQPDMIIITQDIQFVAYIRQKFSAHLYRAEIANIGLPLNVIIPQAFLKYADIKYGIVRDQQTA